NIHCAKDECGEHFACMTRHAARLFLPPRAKPEISSGATAIFEKAFHWRTFLPLQRVKLALVPSITPPSFSNSTRTPCTVPPM
ncbi:hypothetical protein MKK52_07055, partial [Methylobacterium sp. J-067]